MVSLSSKNPWYVNNPVRLEEIKQEISQKYPKLHLTIEKSTVFIRGLFQIFSEDKKIIDDFLIEIEFPYDFPQTIPHVREIGGRIPKEPNRHINPTGDCCLFVLEEYREYYPIGSPFSTFIEKAIVPFFVNQSYFEATGKWFGERRHGFDGVLDYYNEKYGNKSELVIKQLLIYISRKKIRGHWPCYCGSGKKLSKCHIKELLYYWSNYKNEA